MALRAQEAPAPVPWIRTVRVADPGLAGARSRGNGTARPHAGSAEAAVGSSAGGIASPARVTSTGPAAF